ncbi:MAG: Gfo/Idh/MocA family oxidoreductase [Bryobacterales bacterium]|nr:Gfo/Idh/MocA family oxidoreductase [Bryobacterales bacterium]
MRLFAFLALLSAPLAAQESKIAVIGLVHSHVWGHLGKMIKGEPARLVGIAETVPDLVNEAKKRGAADSLFFADYRSMLEQTRPDIVWAFVENNRHLEIVEACAPRKIHVIFEKPLAATLADARRIQTLAKRHGIQVMTNYQMAWWPQTYAAKAQADAGAVGQVFRLRGIVGHGGPGGPTGLNKYFFDWLTDPVKNGAGALMDFGCYNALWSLWYLGRPDSVYARVNQLRPAEFPKVEDNAVVILSYPQGVGIFEGSWDLPRGFQDLEVFGRSGSLYVTSRTVELQKGREAPRQVAAPPLAPQRAEPIAHLLHAVRSGTPLDTLVSLEINVGVVEIIEAAKRSLKTGSAVRLPLR